MMRPGPTLRDGAVNHRVKRARLMRRAFIDVNDKTRQHHERGKIVNHITDRYDPAPGIVVEPHQQARDQEQHRAHRNGPEIQFLTAIEEPDFLGFEWIFIRGVLAHSSQPPSIGLNPRHRRKPIDELKQEEELKQHSKPRMEQARSWTTAEEWRNPVE